MNDSLILPSFIAPFLSTVPPTDSDSVTYQDLLSEGGTFVAQWDKHVENHDENRLKVQLKLYFDGSMSFVYKHFTHGAMEFFEKNENPVKIGIQDWLPFSSDGNSTGKLNSLCFPFSILVNNILPNS